MNRIVFPSRLSGTIDAIPSKSASHRAVLMAALAQGTTDIEPLLLSQDIRATLDCCQQLGITEGVVMNRGEYPDLVRVRILGRAGDTGIRSLRVLDCGESGSTLRFLIPLALDGRGPVRFTGHGRLMQRPLHLYESMFRPQGVRWELKGDELLIDGRLNPGEYEMPGDVSSQFVTGLLLALPLLDAGSRIILTSPLQSFAYVELTRLIQSEYGIRSFWENDRQSLVIPGRQVPRSPRHLKIEGDWSQAAFYLTAGALGDSSVSVTGLPRSASQSDSAILDILGLMGAEIRISDDKITVMSSRLHSATVDCSQCPDIVPILSVAMAAAGGESRITGAHRLRLKESDRLSAVRQALNAVGGRCEETEDGLLIRGGLPLHGGTVNGCGDHRIVMAMAIASALSDEPVIISDAESVAKSDPAFWDEFSMLGGKWQ